MPQKQFTLDEHTVITIYKRKTSRHMRLSIAASGQVRVSIPLWVPYRSGLQFARSRAAWIHAQQRPQRLLTHEQIIGKEYQLFLLPAAGAKKVSSRVFRKKFIIKHPTNIAWNDVAVQNVAETACERALKREAEVLLPERLAILAAQHGHHYAGVRVKRLKSRWGSCDQHTNIVLNIFLVQLPWECIDYVLLHELTHTRQMHHGVMFWDEMRAMLPNLVVLRKQMRSYRPTLHGSENLSVA